MKKIKTISMVFLLIGIFTFSCNKHKGNPGDPTPLNFITPSHFPSMIIPADNPMTVEGVALGRKLFYETQMSVDNTVSCGSCHSPAAAFSDTNQFSTGVNGAIGNRNSMALVNLGWQQFFFWDGRAATLEDQIFEPVTNPVEMNDSWPNVVSKLQADNQYPDLFESAFGEPGIDSIKVSKAIAQFLRTMISASSKFDVMYKYFNGIQLTSSEMNLFNSITTDEWQGYDLFNSLTGADCLHCHNGPLMQIPENSNNGLDEVFTDLGRGGVTGNPSDNGKFKVPTLRNIELSYPYMHDGRFQTLDEVIVHYSFDVKQNSPNLDPRMEYAFQGGVQLDATQRAQLKAFLKTMTDWDFINNPNFQDPN